MCTGTYGDKERQGWHSQLASLVTRIRRLGLTGKERATHKQSSLVWSMRGRVPLRC